MLMAQLGLPSPRTHMILASLQKLATPKHRGTAPLFPMLGTPDHYQPVTIPHFTWVPTFTTCMVQFASQTSLALHLPTT
jgi:hypothetical protein